LRRRAQCPPARPSHLARALRGCFVTGTDTGAGKSVVAAAIAAALVRRGKRVAAFKPVLTGTDEPAEPDWPPDDELLAAATGQHPADVAPLRFGPPVSPHLAAGMAGRAIEPHAIVAAARAAAANADLLVVEGVGGILVPLTLGFSVRDLARELALPVVIAARPGLGTINHTLLTIEALRAAAIEPAGVVLTPWPSDPGPVQRSNRQTIGVLGQIEVAPLRRLARADASALAEAGAALPLGRWIDGA
jgi:dethiobiotin synthetase